MEKRASRRLGVILVPLPLQGHLTPMLQLGTVLHSRGFSVTVAHPAFNSPTPENHPDFAFVSLPDGVGSAAVGNLLEVIAALNSNCREPLEKCIEGLQGQVCCIIYDSIMHFASGVARRSRLPGILFRPTTAAYMQSYHTVLSLHEKMIIPLPDSQLDESVPGLHSIIRFKDLPAPISSNIGQTLLQFVKSFCDDVKSSSAVIWNSLELLDDFSLQQLQHQYNLPFFPIGPLHKMAPSSPRTSLLPEDAGCIPWLDRQAPKSVLYVSLGSVATMSDRVLAETAWGIANSGQAFLWAIRPSSVSGSEWMETLPEEIRGVIRERGLIVKWAPQKEVLAHPAVGGFLSHCGWNSTLESMCEGVAMICRPFFGDQMMNARFLIHVWGVGVEIEDVDDRKSIEEAVRLLMGDERGDERRRRAAEMKHELKLATQRGGSSYRSLDGLVEFITSLDTSKTMMAV